MSGQYGYTGPRDAVRGSSRDRIGSDDRDVKTSIDITTKYVNRNILTILSKRHVNIQIDKRIASLRDNDQLLQSYSSFQLIKSLSLGRHCDQSLA